MPSKTEEWRHTWAVAPAFASDQAVQLGRPIAGMFRTSGDNRLLTLLAPDMIAVTQGTGDVPHNIVVLSVDERGSLASVHCQ